MPALLPFMFLARFVPSAFPFCPYRGEFIPLCSSLVTCPYFWFSGGFFLFPPVLREPSSSLGNACLSSATGGCCRASKAAPFGGSPRRCGPFCLSVSSREALAAASLKSAFLNSILIILLLSFLPCFRITSSIILYCFMVIITQITFCLQFLQQPFFRETPNVKEPSVPFHNAFPTDLWVVLLN